MREILSFFILCVAGTFVSCEDSHIYHQLEEIESLIIEETDSAALLLNTIQSKDNLTGRQQPLYDLLRIHLGYLQETTFASDSVIASVVHYYEKEEDWKRLMKAYYLWGCISYELHETPKAQRCFLNALDAAENIKQPNPVMLGRIYNRCGDLYVRQNAYENALVMHKKSVETFEQMADTSSLLYVYRNIARVYQLMEKPDSVVLYYEKSGEMAQLYNNEEMYYTGIIELTGFLIEHDIINPLVSENLYKIKTRLEELPDYCCLTIGQYYRKTGNIDSAFYYLEQSKESENLYTKAASYQELSKLEKYQGDKDKALNYLECYVEFEQTILDQTRTEQVVRVQAEYNYEKTERENLKLKIDNYKNRIRLYQTSGIILLIVIITSCLLYITIRQIKKQREINKKVEREKRGIELLYRQTQLEIEKNEKEIERLTNVIEQGKALPQIKIQHVEKQLLQLQSEQRSNQSTLTLLGKDIRESAVFLKFYQAGTGQKISIKGSDWAALQTLIETVYPDFLLRLFSKYNPSQKELRLCLLLKTGLSVSAIAIVLSCTTSSVSVTRSRLYTKITGRKGSSHEFDDYLNQL